MNPEKKWLVKSSDSIQGPLEFDVVVEYIFTGDIHLLDEIKGPFERWRPIKDHSLFAAAIEKLKATTYHQRENTVTATIDIGTKTHELTNSQTISITNRGEDSPTPTKTPVIESSRPQQNYQEPVANSPRDFNPQVPHQPKRRFPAVFILSFLLLVIGGASYLVLDFKQSRLIEQKISAYDQLTDVAIDSLKVGEYQRALKNFRMAYNISPQDPNLLIEMSPLSVQLDGQFSQTQDQLETMLATQKQKSLTKIAQNIIGLSYSYREQYAGALASYNLSLDLDDQFMPALLNKSFVLIKLEKFDDAVKLMRTVVSENPDEAIAHYFYIRALAEKGLALDDKMALKEALSVSDQFAQKFADFRQEVLFLIAIVNQRLKVEGEPLVGLVNQFLQVDIDLTKLHVHDTLVDFQSFNWLDYFNYCKVLEKGLPEYNAKMLHGFCLLKVNRPLDAKNIFEELLHQSDSDGILQALYAATLLSLKDLSRAKNALGFIGQIKNKKPVVETILRGCLKAGDLSCGEAIFRGRHAKHISLLYSHWGNSEVNFAKDRRKTRNSVLLGLGISSNFAPLLKIRRKF